MKNPMAGVFCFAMIGRPDIEGSKSIVAMGAWLPQASYPCGNFSAPLTGSIGHAFAVSIRTGSQNQVSFCPFTPGEAFVLAELTLGHLRYRLTDVPPQSNFGADCPGRHLALLRVLDVPPTAGTRPVGLCTKSDSRRAP
ncbi:hypothetical protein M514_27894 [Trichuris suis]|uniref:Regulator of rDNA transcription protein 15 n=1 Tax=Trichuris suis TaxID=68888 RepID=A0A085MRS7_9BILA|nr:hypothetical protein M514_27894 [Trichuris suis]